MKDIKGEKGTTAPISLLNDKKMQKKFIALAHSEFSKRTVLAELYPSLPILDNDDIKNKAAARVNYYISKHARDILLDEEVMKQHQHLGPYYTAFETKLKSTIKHIIADKARRDAERQARKEQGLSASASTGDKIRMERETKKAEKAAAKDTEMKEVKAKKVKAKTVDPIGIIESGIAGITSLFKPSATPAPVPQESEVQPSTSKAPQQRKRKVKEEVMEIEKLPTRKSLRHGLTEAEKKQQEEELAKLTEEANKAKQAKKAELAARLQKGREERAKRIAEEQQKQQTEAILARQKQIAAEAALRAQVEQAEEIKKLQAELAKIQAENEKLKREREEKSNSAEKTRAQKRPLVDQNALADVTEMMKRL